jgi:hypothetical protein
MTENEDGSQPRERKEAEGLIGRNCDVEDEEIWAAGLDKRTQTAIGVGLSNAGGQ